MDQIKYNTWKNPKSSMDKKQESSEAWRTPVNASSFSEPDDLSLYVPSFVHMRKGRENSISEASKEKKQLDSALPEHTGHYVQPWPASYSSRQLFCSIGGFFSSFFFLYLAFLTDCSILESRSLEVGSWYLSLYPAESDSGMRSGEEVASYQKTCLPFRHKRLWGASPVLPLCARGLRGIFVWSHWYSLELACFHFYCFWDLLLFRVFPGCCLFSVYMS